MTSIGKGSGGSRGSVGRVVPGCCGAGIVTDGVAASRHAALFGLDPAPPPVGSAPKQQPGRVWGSGHRVRGRPVVIRTGVGGRDQGTGSGAGPSSYARALAAKIRAPGPGPARRDTHGRWRPRSGHRVRGRPVVIR